MTDTRPMHPFLVLYLPCEDLPTAARQTYHVKARDRGEARRAAVGALGPEVVILRVHHVGRTGGRDY